MKEYIFKSMKEGKTIIRINGGMLEIERPGAISKLSHGFSGTKSILINNISSVQIKKAGIAQGYIQFGIAGSIEKKSGIIKGKKDENIVYYDSTFHNKETNQNALEIKEYIDNYNSQNHNATTIIQESDKYDQLAKLKKLLEEDIITQEEFDSEKSKLLNK